MFKSFTFAFSGIASTIKSERNFKIHLVAAICALLLGIYFKLPVVEFIILLLTITLVLCAELLNTAIEKTIDISCGARLNATAKLAKDAAAGAVFLTALNAVVVGILLFGKRVFVLLISG
ncbi:MAG: diacylglycerol kinase family protein [Clostridiales bacterium]|nr:diacylglycerol kinase family protein [Clostridiales bacterium]